MEKPNLPSFFYDNSDSDKCEEVIDYFMSWTLRCAEKKYSTNKKLQTYAKRILSTLIFDESNRLDEIDVVEVKAWKQSNNIDLWFHVELGRGKKYALIIENKLYAYLKPHQLKTYKEVAETYYKDKVDEFEVKYLFLRCADDYQDADLQLCEESGFKAVLLYDLKLAMQADEATGNDLFDEFWFYWWMNG